MHHGYEQQGFEVDKFLALLKKRGCYSIAAMGELLRDEDGAKYRRDYSGSLTSPFYVALQCGEREERGKSLYDAIKEFQLTGAGRPGRCFWRMIWQLLVACRYLKTNHGASFRSYILGEFSSFIGRRSITDGDFLSTDTQEWSSFVEKTKPWRPLMGIGANTFAFIFGDIVEARFASESDKLDDANLRFFRVTGIAGLIGNVERKSVIRFLGDLATDYTLREINKGIYTYCSVREREQFGYCRSLADCKRCGVNAVCEKRIDRRQARGGSHGQAQRRQTAHEAVS